MSIAACVRVCACLSLTLLLAGCETTEPATVALRFEEIPVSTVTVTRKPDGSVIEDRSGDPALLGRKVVGLQVGVFVPTTIESIELTYWAAGNRAGARSYEKVINDTYTPGPGPTAIIHKMEIPGADKFQLCQALYYMFSARYRFPDGTTGSFVGQPRVIQLSRKVLTDGRVEAASCGPPPGPNE